jgi:hypothetical protein
MRMPWSKTRADQLELLDAEPDASRAADHPPAEDDRSIRSTRSSTRAAQSSDGRPLNRPGF